MSKMQGRKVIVTGSAIGIGRGVALEFARAGADVAVHYAHSRKEADEAVGEIRAAGVRAQAFAADFRDVAAVKRFAGEAMDFLGGVDSLINNAGVTTNLPFEEVTVEQFETLYNVNIRAQFFLTQSVLPALLKGKHPTVINITSVHALEGSPEHSVYAGTKGAIVAYTRSLAIELALKGIRVNAIAPGAVAVENHFKAIPGYDPVAWGRMIPAGFEGLPADIGKVAVFLASEDSRYILGQIIVADGGTTSWLPFGEQFRNPTTVRFGKGYVPGISGTTDGGRMKDMISLSGKVVVITGAAKGIGRQIAETYLAHGARVVIGDLLEEEGRAAAAKLGKDAAFQRCDVADPKQARELVRFAQERFGGLDVLVNNAAYNPTKAEERVTVEDYPEEVFRRTVDVDINGTFYCSREAARIMKELRSGCILSIASVAGVVAFRNQIAHVTCKAAIIRMSQAMALELGPHGIRVNTISPGSTVTDATRSLFYGTEAVYKERAQTLLSFIPVGRPAEVTDIANAALFLASDLSSYITGHNLVVDGGWTAGYSRNF